MKKCSVEGCNRNCHGKGYCLAHYKQVCRHGKIVYKTIFVRDVKLNKIIIKDNFALIELSNISEDIIGYAKIDLDDVKRCKKYRWYIRNGYVYNHKIGLLHHFIFGRPSVGMCIDHINRDKLDNRKCNLRMVTHMQNMHNQKLRCTNKSGYTGVGFYLNRWCAHIMINNKRIQLGRFINKRNAIKARKQAEKEYWKEVK